MMTNVAGNPQAIGGTGLGLFIVKHGAMYSGAGVKVESTLGEGIKDSTV